jgi:hypothetical protein
MNTMAGAALRACSNPGRADPHKHLYEFGTAALEEGDFSLSGRRLGKQGLAGPGRTYKKDSLGDPAAQTGEPLRGLEKLDYLPQLRDGFVCTAHVLEGHADLLRRHLGGLTTPHTEDAACAPAGRARGASIDVVPEDPD